MDNLLSSYKKWIIKKFSFILKNNYILDDQPTYQTATDLINEILNKENNKQKIIQKIINRDEDIDYIKDQLYKKDFNLYLSVNINYTLKKIILNLVAFLPVIIIGNIIVFLLFSNLEDGGSIGEAFVASVWTISFILIVIILFFTLKFILLKLVNFIYNLFLTKERKPKKRLDIINSKKTLIFFTLKMITLFVILFLLHKIL